MSRTNLKEDSVTQWLTDLKDGDQWAATRLWRFLAPRLQRLSKSVVSRKNASYDEEDVAQSAFITLCKALQDGRYVLSDRDQLWKLVAVIAVNKARNRVAFDQRLRRGGGEVAVTSAETELNSLESADLTPEQHLTMTEECGRLMGLLERDGLRHVALLKVEGHTNGEIAATLGCSRRSVQRRLKLIRDIWTQEIQ